ncbi:MAG TPA: alpha/beta fold hydrolase [Solirubrobacteraceae bacterium]|nr:alpha/beta fold hydrolase [Solirubrobacteraceae bacterium]
MPESVVLLHGFGGTGRTWDGVVARLDRERYMPLALDLPGHGSERDCERPITFPRCVARVLERAPERFSLCGYSLGGRIALQLVLAAPQRVRTLVLVSTSAGIEDPLLRAARRHSDDRLAAELRTGDLEGFIARWRSQPLFAGEPPEVGALARTDHRRNDPSALADALSGLSVGRMEPAWDRLGELDLPVTLVVGERDERYRALARRMVALLPAAALRTVAGGHALVLENPAAVAGVLQGLDPEPRR